MREIRSKLTIKTPKQCHWRRSGCLLPLNWFHICDALRDLEPFVQFKKREKHPWRSATFSKVVGFCSGVSIVDFEQLNAGSVEIFGKTIWVALYMAAP